METNFSKNSKQIVTNFECKFCDYKCCLKHHYEQHCKSKKHSINIVNKNVNNNVNVFYCTCGKEYKSRVGLWKHKKVCEQYVDTITNSSKDDNEITVKDFIKFIIKNNVEWQTIMKEVIKNGMNNTNSNNINSNNTNNIHNTFNLDFYVNETYKNDINFSELIDTIKHKIEELESDSSNNKIISSVDKKTKIDNIKCLDN